MLRIAMQTLWPAFLMAIAAEGFFFSIFDVSDLAQVLGYPDARPLAGYTLGFFFFWWWISLGALLSHYLSHVSSDHKPPS